MMPDGDGWKFRDRQLARPDARHIPVSLLSAARNLRVDRLKPAAVMSKPFNLDQLLDTIAGLVG